MLARRDVGVVYGGGYSGLMGAGVNQKYLFWEQS